jgi:putative NIF3 family GTP cyclohydrolase 1 type 2
LFVVKVREITEELERFAPLYLQESYDNAGLIVGSPEMAVSQASFALMPLKK